MMKRKKIAIIGANKPLEPFYSKIDRTKFEIYAFAWAEGAVCEKYADRFYPISFTEKEKILEECRTIGIDGVTSFSLESAIPTVQYIAQALGLVCNDSIVIDWVGHKNKLRTLLSEAGLNTPKSYHFHNVQDLMGIPIKEYPLIVKPADGGGSKGVNLVLNYKELLSAYSYAMNYSKTKEIVIESYIEGREYSVEYITYRGRHSFLSITDKITSEAPHFIELEHRQPSSLNDSMQEEVKKVVERGLTSLGISNSASHTELKIDKSGNIYFIEVGPRLGGDYITSDLVKLSTNVDLVNLSLELCCGIFSSPKITCRINHMVLFYSPYTKDLVNNALINEKMNIVSNNLEEYRDCCENNSERSGCLILRR